MSIDEIIQAIQSTIMNACLCVLAVVFAILIGSFVFRKIKGVGKQGRASMCLWCVLWCLYGGKKPDIPPVVTQEGIKLKTLEVGTGKGGLEVSWETKDDRIVVGEDTFIIKCRDRQIPARIGWGAWREIGRTKDTSFSADGFWKSRDIMIRIEVDKGAIE